MSVIFLVSLVNLSLSATFTDKYNGEITIYPKVQPCLLCESSCFLMESGKQFQLKSEIYWLYFQLGFFKTATIEYLEYLALSVCVCVCVCVSVCVGGWVCVWCVCVCVVCVCVCVCHC